MTISTYDEHIIWLAGESDDDERDPDDVPDFVH